MKRTKRKLGIATLMVAIVLGGASAAVADKGRKSMKSMPNPINLNGPAGFSNKQSQPFQVPNVAKTIPMQMHKQNFNPSPRANFYRGTHSGPAQKLIASEQATALKQKLISQAPTLTRAGGLSPHSPTKIAGSVPKYNFKANAPKSIHFASHHCHQPLTHQLWHHYHPTHCHWWWNYCTNLHACTPTQYYYWNWYYVSCPQMVNGVVVKQNASWYLGLSGMLLPGSGLGVDAVASNSPAEAAGIHPGMVIKAVNGLEIVDEATMQTAIANSNGVLSLLVVADAAVEPQKVIVQMKLVTPVNF